jgi:diacylglycerol kinase (ATP)
LNSSIEAAIDRISFEINDLSKRAKDMGSAAVMLALLTCVLIWTTIIYEEFWGVLVNR